MIRSTAGKFLRYLVGVPRCVVCRRPLEIDAALRGTPGCTILCPACRAAWEREKLELCPQCGLAQLDCGCMPELLADGDALSLIHLGEYRADHTIGRFILYLKDHRSRHAAEFVAAQLSHAICAMAADFDCAPSDLCVTYLPRSRRARRASGHDQAELLARAIAARLGTEFAPLLTRSRESRAQKAIRGARARAANVAGTFAPAKPAGCCGRMVLLVDDVVTTGASLAEGTRILREMGADGVICVAIGLASHRVVRKISKNHCNLSSHRV